MLEQLVIKRVTPKLKISPEITSDMISPQVEHFQIPVKRDYNILKFT